MVHRCKAFSDCKEVLYLSEVGNEKFIVQKVLCDHKGTKGFWVIRIIIGYIIETSKAIKETYIINFEGNEIVVKTKDKKVMTFEVNKREIKMVYPRRVASGQIKSGRVDSI